MAAYQLLGGNRNNPALLPERVQNEYIPNSRLNMFNYKGPRRVKVSPAQTTRCLCLCTPRLAVSWRGFVRRREMGR